YEDFNLDVASINYSPVEKEILIEHLRTHNREKLDSGDGVIREEKFENYLVAKLMDFDDINYDTDSKLLYKLSAQIVEKLKTYLKSDEEIHNVLMYRREALSELIHSQMQQHFKQETVEFEVNVTKSFIPLEAEPFTLPDGKRPVNYRSQIEKGTSIRDVVFEGFKKCLYNLQKFQSNPERLFASILEDPNNDVLKWVKPSTRLIHIFLKDGGKYNPDFIVETKDAKWICEVKDSTEMENPVVLEKAEAAKTFCKNASEYESSIKGKPWKYALIPDASINAAATFKTLSETYKK